MILTTESIYDIIMVTQGHLQGQKVNSKGKTAKICFLTIAASVIPLFDVFLTEESTCSTILMIRGHFKVKT